MLYQDNKGYIWKKEDLAGLSQEAFEKLGLHLIFPDN